MNTNTSNNRGNQLTILDVEPGQQLILTSTSSYGYNDIARKVTTRVLTVKKVLKTRLVCEDKAGREYRFIVEFSKTYTARNGWVSTDLEGERDRDSWHYNRDHRILWTTDDAGLTEYLAKIDAHNREVQARDEARKALDTFKASLNVENAEAAIAALQQYVATQKKEQTA
jgi:hypothetical protein